MNSSPGSDNRHMYAVPTSWTRGFVSDKGDERFLLPRLVRTQNPRYRLDVVSNYDRSGNFSFPDRRMDGLAVYLMIISLRDHRVEGGCRCDSVNVGGGYDWEHCNLGLYIRSRRMSGPGWFRTGATHCLDLVKAVVRQRMEIW